MSNSKPSQKPVTNSAPTAKAKPKSAPAPLVNPTMEDLAQPAGDRKITVSRALRDSPSVTHTTPERTKALAADAASQSLRLPLPYSRLPLARVWRDEMPGSRLRSPSTEGRNCMD
jgi:hypothetical protein